MTQILKMYNPELDAVGDTTAEGYRLVWQHRGWQLQSAAAARASDILGHPVGDLERLTTDELRVVISHQADLEEPAKSAKKPALIKAFVDSVSGGDTEPAVVAEVEGSADNPSGGDAGENKE